MAAPTLPGLDPKGYDGSGIYPAGGQGKTAEQPPVIIGLKKTMVLGKPSTLILIGGCLVAAYLLYKKLK